MFKNLIATILVCSILQSLVYIISPQSHIKNMLLTGCNIIFSSAIFAEIIVLIKQII